LRHANVRLIAAKVTALDASQHLLTLDDGSTLVYDWLSINTEAIQNRELVELSMPGARTHGLFVHPFDAFGTLWPRVVEMGAQRALRIAVIGAGATGVELACAVAKRLPNAAATLVVGKNDPGDPGTPGANDPQTMQDRLRKVLKNRGITVLQDSVSSIEAHQVHLGTGASLACDVALLATGVHPPAWLVQSGLGLDAQGFIVVNAYQQSINQAHVFATGDVSTRNDQTWARNGAYATRAGPALLNNLQAATNGAALKACAWPQRTLNILFCGGHYALANWGQYSAQGHWVWWLKNWLDRRFVAKHTKG
jgi:NADH dehydrogenase FAD-containing subunit